MNFNLIRPSTLLRVVEDGVITAGSSIARRTKSVAHAVSIEYQARQLDAYMRHIARTAQRYEQMTPEERYMYADDMATIEARAAELAARRASRSGN